MNRRRPDPEPLPSRSRGLNRAHRVGAGPMAIVRRAALVLAGTAVLPCAAAPAQAPPPANRIQALVEGLRSDAGQVVCALFSSMDGFPKQPERAIAQSRSPVVGRRALCDFPDLGPGTYAVSVFHDENSNGRLDTGFLGIPREGVGASNDAKGHFGPPRFAAAAFRFAGGTLQLRITVRYL